MNFFNRISNIKWFDSNEGRVHQIDKALKGLPQSTMEILLDRVVAKHLPKKFISFKPYGRNPRSIYAGKVPYGVTSNGNLKSGG